MTRAADIDIPPGGGTRDRPVLAPNDLIEAMRPFVEEFWSEVLGTSYATSFVSNHGRLDAWEQYVGGRDTLIARVADVYDVDITKVYDQPTWKVLAFVRTNTTLSRAPLSPAETAQLLGFEHLQLQWHAQPVLRSTRAQPHDALSALDRCPADQGLQAVEIGQPRSIRLVGPAKPQLLELSLYRRIRVLRLRLDPGADRVGDEAVDRIRGPCVAAHHVTRARAQRVAPAAHQRVDAVC